MKNWPASRRSSPEKRRSQAGASYDVEAVAPGFNFLFGKFKPRQLPLENVPALQICPCLGDDRGNEIFYGLIGGDGRHHQDTRGGDEVTGGPPCQGFSQVDGQDAEAGYVCSMDEWQPRPDPALLAPHRPGMRAHRHPQNRLRPSVFLQHQIWIDYWGNEHEIESMPLDYIENVIGFCLAQSERIKFLVALELAERVIFDPASARTPETAEFLFERSAEEWLWTTPLLRALDRRREQLSQAN